MRRFRWVAETFIIALIVMPCAGISAHADSRAERELRDLERERSRAIREHDEAAIDRIYANDFTGVAGNGAVIDRVTLREVFRRDDPRVSFATHELAVRVFGKSAVMTGLLLGTTADGDTVVRTRATHVWLRRGGRWQIVAAQATPVRRS